MKIAVNAVSAKMGGAVTYLRSMLPELRRRLSDDSSVVVWRADVGADGEQWPSGISYRTNAGASGALGPDRSHTARRLWFDQFDLPRIMRQEKFDALLSSANFGPIWTPGRHVLLVRNSAYFDKTYLRRIRVPRVRAYYAAQRCLTLAAMAGADSVLFPSRSMLELVASFTGGPRRKWLVAPYGTRHEAFRRSTLPPRLLEKPLVELLNVSLYCDQKNLGTLARALEALNDTQPNRYHLRLTAGFRRGWDAGIDLFPNFVDERDRFARLERLGLAEDVDWKQYGSLPALYHASDIFVFPSYSESFGHSLVEAMAAGLPIVAADVPINREMCGRAAVYFSPFEPLECAAAIRRVVESPSLLDEMRAESLSRAATFTWERHVDILMEALAS